jgi:hypothetical protein
MLALSTQRCKLYYGDFELTGWQSAGLPQPTKARAVIQTIARNTILRRLGTLTDGDFEQARQSVRDVLQL